MDSRKQRLLRHGASGTVRDYAIKFIHICPRFNFYGFSEETIGLKCKIDLRANLSVLEIG